jgi:hypothetical protein
MAFMRWQLRRGVLEPPDSERPGSPWWRAVNERLLRDGCESVALSGDLTGPPSSRTVDYWMSFADYPTARSWYRAHNASVVAAYLDHRDLAEAEGTAERFFMNVVLCRVLYTHALVAAPRLQQLYEWSAHELSEPGLLDCIRGGSLIYARPFEERSVWHPRKSALLRLAHNMLPPQRQTHGNGTLLS